MADWVIENNFCYNLNSIVAIQYLGFSNNSFYPNLYKIIFSNYNITNSEVFITFSSSLSFEDIIFNLKKIRELDEDTIPLNEFCNYLAKH